MDDNARWSAVVARNQAFDGAFVYCVKTTKIFCRPICKARLARRSNVEFYGSAAEAQTAGYRACKRCQPQLSSFTPEADKIKKACDLLRTLPDHAPLPGLQQLAKEAGLTKHHFHRLFKRETGKTPREYALAIRAENNSETTGSTGMTTPITPPTNNNIEVPDIAYDELLDLTISEQDVSEDLLKESPSANFESFVVYYSVIETTYGPLLFAFHNREVHKVELGMSESELMESLDMSFPTLYYLHSPVSLANGEDLVVFQKQVDAVVEALEQPSGKVLEVPFPTSLETTEEIT